MSFFQESDKARALREQLLHVDSVLIVDLINWDGPEACIPGRIHQEGVVIDRGAENRPALVFGVCSCVWSAKLVAVTGDEALQSGNVFFQATV